jgi:hypothetical protein
MERYDREWTELRQKIGEIYEINPRKSTIEARFYEKQNMSSEFIVNETEKFTLIDVRVRNFINWTSGFAYKRNHI